MLLRAFALLLCLAPLARAEDVRVGTKVGELHPDFVFPTVETPPFTPITRGGLVQLSAYRGKKVLLIHFASW